MKASEKQKKYFDFKVNHQCYHVGEKVWVRDKARKRGVCPKLQRRYKGPYVVMERVSEVLYKLLDQEKGVEMIIHFNRLKPHVSSSLTGVPVLQGGGPERPPPPVMTSGVAHKSPVQELTLGGIFAPSLTMATMTVPGALNIAPVNGLVPRVSETHGASAPLAEIESAPLLAPETITAADMEYAPVVVTVPPSGLTASADRMPAVAGVPGSEIVSESSSGPTTSVDDGLVPVAGDVPASVTLGGSGSVLEGAGGMPQPQRIRECRPTRMRRLPGWTQDYVL